ncbi:MAG: chitobiase/beta-hexosaminidase C-terminal domain-containing protein [Lachnospiraceae bacterium]|nr:chitobiase/beta-hexosaminidase C-terminal domain-containing protein [Lachnospiraceae bacterium]
MKCKRCGATLVDGHVYCDHCGAEVQFVPDFNELEEDILPTLVTNTPTVEETSDVSRPPVWRRRIVAVLLLVCIVGVSVFSYRRTYSYLFHRAERLDREANFAEAAVYYNTALARKQTVDAYIKLGNDYSLLQEFDDAEDAYRRALALARSLGEDPLVAYDALLTLFEEIGDADGAEVLYDEISKKRILEALATKFVRPPLFSEPEGEYYTFLSLILSSTDGFDIFYTLDGTEPGSDNGKRFKKKKPIKLLDGVTTVKACCVDTAGKKSMVVKRTYRIDYPEPDMPTANPSGGTFHSPMKVVLSKEGDGAIYYSWNGRTPSKDSTRYTGPIDIPEGNNVLSAIVIDENDVESDVLRCNYIYLP